jgi:Methylamine utilisation protein MauE
MSSLSFVAAAIVGAVFGSGALAKLVRFRQWQEALQAYRLPPNVSRAASVGVPLAEAAVVALLLAGRALAGGALTLMLLAVFSLALLSARQNGSDRIPCGCFGSATPHDYRLLVARNAALAVLAGIVLAGGRQHLTIALPPSGAPLLPIALVALGVALLGWLARELSASMRRQRG